MNLFEKECKNTFLVRDTKFGFGKKNSYLFRDDKYIQFDYACGDDCTRLIVDTEPLELCGHNVFKSYVTWYKKSEKVRILNGMQYDDDRKYYYILLELDPKLIFNDEKYYMFFMSELLKHDRVFKYIDNSFDETAKFKIGLYVGGVSLKDNVYSKVFYEDIGLACHNLDDMVILRHKYMHGDDCNSEDIHLDVTAIADQLIEFIDNEKSKIK